MFEVESIVRCSEIEGGRRDEELEVVWQTATRDT